MEPVRVTQHFDLSAESVFNAWTDPEVMRLWMFKSETNEIINVDTEPRVGGRFSILEKSGEEFIDHFGEYHEIDRPNHLAFSLEVPRHFPGVTQVTINLYSTENGCEMDLVQTGVSPEVTEQPWRDMFGRLSEVLRH